MTHFSLILEDDKEEKTYENLSDKEKEALDSYLSYEAELFKDLEGAVREVNKFIAATTGKKSYYDENNEYTNYVSREDYFIFFGMEDRHIDMWEYYAKEIMRKPELVKNMKDKSVVYKSHKESSPPKEDSQNQENQEDKNK